MSTGFAEGAGHDPILTAPPLRPLPAQCLPQEVRCAPPCQLRRGGMVGLRPVRLKEPMPPPGVGLEGDRPAGLAQRLLQSLHARGSYPIVRLREVPKVSRLGLGVVPTLRPIENHHGPDVLWPIER